MGARGKERIKGRTTLEWIIESIMIISLDQVNDYNVSDSRSVSVDWEITACLNLLEYRDYQNYLVSH